MKKRKNYFRKLTEVSETKAAYGHTAAAPCAMQSLHFTSASRISLLTEPMNRHKRTSVPALVYFIIVRCF